MEGVVSPSLDCDGMRARATRTLRLRLRPLVRDLTLSRPRIWRSTLLLVHYPPISSHPHPILIIPFSSSHHVPAPTLPTACTSDPSTPPPTAPTASKHRHPTRKQATPQQAHHVIESMSELRMLFTMFVGPCSFSLKIDSTTLISVDVVSSPQNADQSFATIPAPSTSDPRFTVPATRGILGADNNRHVPRSRVRGRARESGQAPPLARHARPHLGTPGMGNDDS